MTNASLHSDIEREAMSIFRELTPKVQEQLILLLRVLSSDESEEAARPPTDV